MSVRTKPKGPKAYVPPADVNKDGADHDRLRNVRPITSGHDPLNPRCTDPVTLPEVPMRRASGSVHCPDSHDLFGGQFGGVTYPIGSGNRPSAPLVPHIKTVLRNSSEPEVKRFSATRIIPARTIVADVFACGNQSVGKYVRQAVRTIPHTVVGDVVAVPALPYVSHPNQTLTYSLEATPKLAEGLVVSHG